MKEVPQSYIDDFNLKMSEISYYLFDKLSGIRGLEPIKANACMYMMVRIKIEEFKDIQDDQDFCVKLNEEEAVLPTPSCCFFAKNFFRIVSIVVA
jgi:aspartate/methionine/tyrosine aminotransferase